MLFIKSQESFDLMDKAMGNKWSFRLANSDDFRKITGIHSVSNPLGAASKYAIFVPYREGLVIQKRDTDKIWFEIFDEDIENVFGE